MSTNQELSSQNQELTCAQNEAVLVQDSSLDQGSVAPVEYEIPQLVRELARHFNQSNHGYLAIQRLWEEDPAKYLKLVQETIKDVKHNIREFEETNPMTGFIGLLSQARQQLKSEGKLPDDRPENESSESNSQAESGVGSKKRRTKAQREE